MTDFPDDFLFGSATAAHQVEGGNVNSDWWDWEHAPGTVCAESSGDGIDHYHRYAEDFALLASLGHQVHRLSVEWARIEPARGEFSQAALDHYRRVLRALADTGMAAMVTLNHFTLPRWLAAEGGWLAHDAVALFGRYCARVVAELGDLMPWICTINEPSVVAMHGYQTGQFPPGERHQGKWRKAVQRLIGGHEAAVDAVRDAGLDSPVGITLAMSPVEVVRDEPAAHVRAAEILAGGIDVYLDGLAGDYVGVQYYFPVRVDPGRSSGTADPYPGERRTLMGWPVDPSGLSWCIERAATRSGLPVFVTENGIATDDDAWRIAYMRDHVLEAKRALDDGIDVRGFLYWSAFDNFEWAYGYGPTFGMIGIDREDGLRRIVRDSARWWERLCRTRTIPPA